MQRHYFANKGPSSQGFSSSHVWMWELDLKKAECQRIDAFELWCWRRLLRVLWTARRSNQSILKGDQSWVFFGRNDAEAETAILWPPHAKSWLIGKDSDAGRDWGQEEKGMTEDEMAGWHYWVDGRECESTQGVGDGQGGLVCCNFWGCIESDMTEQLNWLTRWLYSTNFLNFNNSYSKSKLDIFGLFHTMCHLFEKEVWVFTYFQVTSWM